MHAMSLSIDLCISGARCLHSINQPVGVNMIYDAAVVGVWMCDCGLRDRCPRHQICSPITRMCVCVCVCVRARHLPAIADLPR